MVIKVLGLRHHSSRWRGEKSSTGSASNSVQYPSFTDLKETISKVSRDLIDLGITKDDVLNSYAHWQTRYVTPAWSAVHGRPFSLNLLKGQNSIGIFTSAELLPTLPKYVISQPIYS